jgi:hypothetical protein
LDEHFDLIAEMVLLYQRIASSKLIEDVGPVLGGRDISPVAAKNSSDRMNSLASSRETKNLRFLFFLPPKSTIHLSSDRIADIWV